MVEIIGRKVEADTEDIKSRALSFDYEEGPFDKSLKVLEANGYRLISLEENAGLRIQEGAEAFISRNGNWVREGALYVKGKGNFITKNSPILEYPGKATQTHRDKKEVVISDAQVQKVLENSIHIPYNVGKIPTKRFGEDGIAVFCFGKNAEKYGLFLKEEGIKAMPLWFVPEDYIEEKDKSDVTQLWFDGISNMSMLDGNGHLHYSDESLGVK